MSALKLGLAVILDGHGLAASICAQGGSSEKRAERRAGSAAAAVSASSVWSVVYRSRIACMLGAVSVGDPYGHDA